MGSRLESGDRLSLDTTEFHLFLEHLDVANAGEKVGLATSIAVKRGKPTVPLPFRSFSLLEIANDWEIFRWEKAIVDDGVILPAVASASDIVVWLLDKVGLAVFIV